MGYSANAITDSLGRYTNGGFDLTTLAPEEVGERIDPWEREVSYKGEATLDEVLTKDKYIKYDLIASILANEEKIKLDTVVGMYASGAIKELRVGKARYRADGYTYIGKKKS